MAAAAMATLVSSLASLQLSGPPHKPVGSIASRFSQHNGTRLRPTLKIAPLGPAYLLCEFALLLQLQLWRKRARKPRGLCQECVTRRIRCCTVVGNGAEEDCCGPCGSRGWYWEDHHQQPPSSRVLARESPVVAGCQVPLASLGYESKYDTIVRARGGGLSAQAQAILLGVARALLLANPANRTPLRKQGLLTRDSRVVERKKYGLKKARKAPQFSKR